MKVKFVYCDQPNVPRCAECHARLSVEHESLNLGGVDDYRCDQCGTKLEVAWVPSHRRADVLIEKLSDTMDSDNARALVEEVIREEAEHAHAATVANATKERAEAAEATVASLRQLLSDEIAEDARYLLRYQLSDPSGNRARDRLWENIKAALAVLQTPSTKP